MTARRQIILVSLTAFDASATAAQQHTGADDDEHNPGQQRKQHIPGVGRQIEPQLRPSPLFAGRKGSATLKW